MSANTNTTPQSVDISTPAPLARIREALTEAIEIALDALNGALDTLAGTDPLNTDTPDDLDDLDIAVEQVLQALNDLGHEARAAEHVLTEAAYLAAEDEEDEEEADQ